MRESGDYKHSSERSDWVTPPEIIEAAREVMGSIDLDPASSGRVNRKVVKATKYYNERMNGLKKPWYGNVWLNPPFGYISVEGKQQSSQKLWREKATFEFNNGKNDVRQMITIFNAATSQSWFRPLFKQTICFPFKRIAYCDPSTFEPQKGNSYASVIVYWGSDPKRFRSVFKDFGTIVREWR